MSLKDKMLTATKTQGIIIHLKYVKCVKYVLLKFFITCLQILITTCAFLFVYLCNCGFDFFSISIMESVYIYE